MNRRQLLTFGAAATASPDVALAETRTRWRISFSEGLDALCFLGPLAGGRLETPYYARELSVFRPRLSAATMQDIAALQSGVAPMGIVGPWLSLILSGGPVATIGSLLWSLDNSEAVLRTAYRSGPYWSAANWAAFVPLIPTLRRVLTALERAEFPAFRRELLADKAARRATALQRRLAGVDVIAEQERLLGRRLDPELEVVLLWFSKPYGIKIGGQRFITHIDYPDEIVIRNAAHELLHPPFDREGPHARAALAVLRRDPLVTGLVADLGAKWNYPTLPGLLDEDLGQALEQIINERLGVAVAPAKRWAEADGGLHVLAAGLYGLLKADGFDRTGGNAERWLGEAARGGRLAPASLHAAAARVLGRPSDQLRPTKSTS